MFLVGNQQLLPDTLIVCLEKWPQEVETTVLEQAKALIADPKGLKPTQSEKSVDLFRML